jgi:GT2 family glycosyltransferase
VDVSIIIVNLNTKDLLLGCLRSVFADTSGLAAEVIVIDNGSSDGSVEMVRQEFPQVRLKLNATNEGFARPNNEGMRMARGRLLFLLNSDTIVTPGAVGTLAAFLDAHPDCGACGPMLRYPDGRVQQSVKGFPTLWTHACDMLFLDALFPSSRLFGAGEMRYFRYDQTAQVDHLMAAAFMVRREVLDTVGMFDERFAVYYNDMDWCYRIMQHGWKIFYIHTAEVIHYHGQTISRLNSDFSRLPEMHENVMWFYQKRYGSWALVVYKLLLVIGFAVRTVGWQAARLIRSSERTRHMAEFSWRTLTLGLRFWKPLRTH